MDEGFDITKGISLAIGNARNPALLKQAAITFFALIGAAIADLIILIVLLLLLGAILKTDILGAMFDFSDSKNARSSIDNFQGGFVTVIAMLYLYPRLKRAALQANGVKIPKDPPGFLEYAVLTFRITLIDSMCWYNRKLLAPALGLGALAIVFALLALLALPDLSVLANLKSGGLGELGKFAGAGIAAFASLGLFLLAAMAYAIAVAIHSVRTMFSAYIFLSGQAPENLAVRKSYDFVLGRTFEAALPIFIFCIAAGITWAFIFIPMFLLAFIPVIGVLIDAIIAIPLIILTWSAYEAYMASLYAHFCLNPKPAAEAGQKKK